MKINLSHEEMDDLVDALDFGYDKIVYSMDGLTDESKAQAVRFRFLRDRLLEYDTPKEEDA